MGFVRLWLLLRPVCPGLPDGLAARAGLRSAASAGGTALASEFMRVDVAVGRVRAVAAIVAVFPVLVLAEIVEEHAAQAFVGLAVLLHRVETSECGAFGAFPEFRVLQRAAGMALQAVPPVDEVAVGPQHDASGGLAVTSRTAGLLVERLEAFAWSVVDDPAHVGLVDAHAERGGRADHARRAGEEPVLDAGLVLVGEGRVERGRVHAVLDEALGPRVAILDGVAVDDAASLVSVRPVEDEPFACGWFEFERVETDVGTVEAGADAHRLVQSQFFGDLGHLAAGRGRGERGHDGT